jgi:hypothetical protein
MSTEPSWFAGWGYVFAGGGVGAALGFVLGQFKDSWMRRRKQKAYWHALNAELKFASGLAQRLLNDPVKAPLYRLPREAFESCYPELLADGAVSAPESDALMAYFNEVATMNRGLDRVADATTEEERHAEYGRNRRKAESLVSGSPLYEEAAAVLAQHVK